MSDDSRLFESLLGEVLLSPNPAAALRDVSGPRPAGWDRSVSHVDEDGLQMAALLVVKLRFERLIAASSRAAAMFDEDAEAFAATFRRYHQSVRATSPMPRDERELFERWLGQDEG